MIYVNIHWYTIWLWLTLPWKITMLLRGEASISMGHLYHGYVSHNQVTTSLSNRMKGNHPRVALLLVGGSSLVQWYKYIYILYNIYIYIIRYIYIYLFDLLDLFVFGIGHIGSICITKILIPLFEYWIILDLFVFGGGYQQRWTGQKGIWQDYIHGLISCCLNTWHPQYKDGLTRFFPSKLALSRYPGIPPKKWDKTTLRSWGWQCQVL